MVTQAWGIVSGGLRGGYSNDYEGEGTLMITREGYSNDYEGKVL